MDGTAPQNDDTSDSDTDSDTAAKDDNGRSIATNGKKTVKKNSKNSLLVGPDVPEQVELRKKTASGLDMFKTLVDEDDDEGDEEEEADDESNDGEEDEDEDVDVNEKDEKDHLGNDMDSDEEIRQLNMNRRTIKRKATEAALEDQDVQDDDIEMVPVNKKFEDGEIWDEKADEEDSRKRKQIIEYSLITADAMTPAQSLVNKTTTKSELIDQEFIKKEFADKDGLPA
ncbi:AdoMet-dependent rRNA methyltransferase spb1 [Modicella reniformis]|uniref:AdoMet-dependent rRNA methyltransferase spb1 n=1 Tax=Modicella reniformis TaxID=1440133 RepID=A0A9P6MDJ9_9FUNG|nr:AdoMet-dependent rRNA methyltransferase spb1 [Modicella reniformis]